MAETYALFPTFVGSYRMSREFTDEEMGFMRACLQDLKPNEGNTTSEYRRVLDASEMAEVRQFCIDSLRHYAEEVVQVEDGEPTITQSWLNLSKKGQWHHMHRHPNSLWSGVLYVKAGENDRIHFHKNVALDGSFQLKARAWNPHNSQSWWLPNRIGELLVFPSTFQHSVPPTESDERISLSFNTFPTKSIGNPDSLTELPL